MQSRPSILVIPLCLISLISVNFSNKKTTQAPKAVAHPTSSCPRASQGQATSRGFLEVSVRSTVSMGAGKPTSATSNAGCNGWLQALEPDWHYKHYLQWYLSVRETALTQVYLSLSLRTKTPCIQFRIHASWRFGKGIVAYFAFRKKLWTRGWINCASFTYFHPPGNSMDHNYLQVLTKWFLFPAAQPTAKTSPIGSEVARGDAGAP